MAMTNTDSLPAGTTFRFYIAAYERLSDVTYSVLGPVPGQPDTYRVKCESTGTVRFADAGDMRDVLRPPADPFAGIPGARDADRDPFARSDADRDPFARSDADRDPFARR